MPLPIMYAVIALCVVLSVWAIVFIARDRPVILRQLHAAGIIEALIVVQAVIAGISAARGSGPTDGLLWWGYLITALILLPGAGLWAFAERTKWSSVVLLVAAVTVAFMEYRLWQIWYG